MRARKKFGTKEYDMLRIGKDRARKHKWGPTEVFGVEEGGRYKRRSIYPGIEQGNAGDTGGWL